MTRLVKSFLRIGFVGLVIAFCVSCLPGVIVPDRQAVRDIATRLDVQPSWEAIYDYLNQAFVPGLTRDQVHEVLDKIGPYRVVYSDADCVVWDSDSGQLICREEIRFTEKDTSWALVGWYFSYDQEGKLVKAHKLESP